MSGGVRAGHLLSCRLPWGRAISLFGKTTGMFSVGAEAGEWVVGLPLGCVASFRADAPERMSGGRRDGTSRGRPRRAVFLSTWPIHKIPPLSSPDGASHCPAFPHLGFISLKGGGGRSPVSYKGGRSLRSPSSIRFTAPREEYDSWPWPHRVVCSAASQHLPRVFRQRQD